MKGRIKAQAVCGLLGCFLLAVPVLADEPKDLRGVYSCQGRNPDGGEYSGKVIIFRKGDAYILLWSIGGLSHQGVAILEGDLLSSSWAPIATPNAPLSVPGIVVYKVQPDRKLVGRWTSESGIMGTETLTFLSQETDSIGNVLKEEISIL